MRFLQHMRSSISMVLGLASLIAVAVVMNAPRAYAQSTSASVSGRVTDQSGAVIVDAEVVVKDVDRGVATIVRTNGEGFYSLPSLIPGNYLMNVRKQGFQTVSVTGITFNLQDNLSRNFVLQVGSSAVSITVNANDIHLNTTDGSVSTVVDQSYIKNMPLNGRSFQDLILLTPGVVTQSPQNGVQNGAGIGGQGEFSVNGQRPESNYYTVDGVSANVGAAGGSSVMFGPAASGSVPAATALGTTQALVSVDALQEFRVQASTYSAEYGRSPGGQFAFETKSGTNQWHGTAYDYLRNGFFDAKDWFNNYFGLPQPPIKQNDFGGTVGGPVRIPKLYDGKDKTFFFVSYEGLRLTAPQPATVSVVPSASLRASAPAPLKQALNAFPLPSPNGLDFGDGLAQFIASWSNPSSLNSTSVRFDHVINDKLRLFFRFSDTGSSAASRQTSDHNGTPSDNEITTYTMRTYTGGASGAFSTHFSNELRFNYSSNEVTDGYVIDAFGGGTPVDLAQLEGLGPGSSQGVEPCYNEGCFALLQGQLPGRQSQWNFLDTVSASWGRHQFKFGADYRRLAAFASLPRPQVTHIYTDQASIAANSASLRVSSFLPGYPLYTNFSAFAQDEWRVTQRLNLSLGLRWEVNPPPDVTQGLKPYTYITQGDPSTWALAPQGTALWQTTWRNFAPRLGAVYMLHSAAGREAVVRGGFGIFYDTGQQLGSIGFNGGPGFVARVRSSAPFPLIPGGVPVVANPPVGRQGLVYAFDPHLQLPYTLQWNASIEQQLGRSQALSLSYIGAHAERLLLRQAFSTPTNPNASLFFRVRSGLTSDYDAAQLQFRRRLSAGLTALASYTWSHCLDYGSQNNVGYVRGNCDFDVRHSLSAAFSYDLPNVGHAGFLNALLNHWGLDDRFVARTAFPVSLNGRTLLQPDGSQYSAGLNFVPGQPVYLYGANCAAVLQGLHDLQPGKGCPGGRAINPQAFSNVTSGFGNAPRNFARGFGAWQMNLAARRDFPIAESLKLQFRAEAFNIFNHPNFGYVYPFFGASNFGQATATLANSLAALNGLYQMGGSRSMQFALKFVF